MARKARYRAAIRAGRIADLQLEQLHGIYGRFSNLWTEQGELSRRQNWLWDRVEDELRWRWQSSTPTTRCHCAICLHIVLHPDQEPF